jgi:hypothetical protein
VLCFLFVFLRLVFPVSRFFVLALYCTNIWMVSCELEQHSTSNYVQLASQSIQHLIYISTRMNLLFNNMQSLVRAVQLHVFMGLLSSVLCCPLRFSFKCGVRFVLFTSFCKTTRVVYLRYLCLFAHSGVEHILCCVFYLFFFVLCFQFLGFLY